MKSFVMDGEDGYIKTNMLNSIFIKDTTGEFDTPATVTSL